MFHKKLKTNIINLIEVLITLLIVFIRSESIPQTIDCFCLFVVLLWSFEVVI